MRQHSLRNILRLYRRISSIHRIIFLKSGLEYLADQICRNACCKNGHKQNQKNFHTLTHKKASLNIIGHHLFIVYLIIAGISRALKKFPRSIKKICKIKIIVV